MTLLQEQVDAQSTVTALLHPKWLETKEGNDRLRSGLDEMRNSAKERANAGGDHARRTTIARSPYRIALRDFAEVEAASQTSRAFFNVDPGEEVWDELSMKEDSVSWRRDGGGDGVQSLQTASPSESSVSWSE